MNRPACRSHVVGSLVILMGMSILHSGDSIQAQTLRFTAPPSPINFLEASDMCIDEQRVRFAPNAPIAVAAPGVSTPTVITDEVVPTASAATASPAPIASFQGIDGQSVPDTMGTVGPQHVVTTLNDAFRVQDRSGRALATMDDEAFWSSVGTRSHYDPRALYDQRRDRWVVVAAYIEQGDAGIAVAVSRTGDPTGWWDRYSFRTLAGHWVDYPMAALNERSVSVTLLSATDSGVDQTIVIYVFDKESLYATPPKTVTANYMTAPAGSLAPVSVYGTTEAGTYFVQSVPYENSVRVYRETPGALVAVATVLARQPWSEFTPLLPQLGSTNRLSPTDTRVMNAVLRNGALWFVQTVFLPAEQATRSAIQWWKVSLDGRLLDFGRIDDPSGAVSYCFPSIAVNRNNDVVIGFSQISAASYPTAAYAVRSALDPPGTFRPSFVLKHGDAPYDGPRWGDYSSTVIDPDDVTFWTIQEYAKTPLNGPRWGVWWGHIPAPAAPPAGRRRSARH